VHTLAIAPLRTESPLQKRSGTARVLKGFHSFTCTPTRSSAIAMSRTCLCLPSYNWYSFTDPGRLSRPWMTAVRKICVVTKRYHRRNVDILITEGATDEKYINKVIQIQRLTYLWHVNHMVKSKRADTKISYRTGTPTHNGREGDRGTKKNIKFTILH